MSIPWVWPLKSDCTNNSHVLTTINIKTISQIMDQTKPVGNIVISKEIANDCICLAVINQVDSSSELTVNEKSIELL